MISLSRYSLFFERKKERENVYMKFSKKRSIFVFSISSWIQPSFFRFMLLFKIYYYCGILKMTKFYFLNVLFRISFQEFLQFYIIHHMKRRIKGNQATFLLYNHKYAIILQAETISKKMIVPFIQISRISFIYKF